MLAPGSGGKVGVVVGKGVDVGADMGVDVGVTVGGTGVEVGSEAELSVAVGDVFGGNVGLGAGVVGCGVLVGPVCPSPTPLSFLHIWRYG